MKRNQVAKVVRILTQYEGQCHTIVEMDDTRFHRELVQIPTLKKEDFEVEVGTVIRCTQEEPFIVEKIAPENVLSAEQFIQTTANFDIISYHQLIEMFEKLKGKVGIFCPDYPDCTMKFLIQMLAYYDSQDSSNYPSPTILQFLNSKQVSDCLKESAKRELEGMNNSQKLQEILPENKDLKDFTKEEFFRLNLRLCQLERGQYISALLFRLARYFEFKWEDEKENTKGYEKKIGEMKES